MAAWLAALLVLVALVALLAWWAQRLPGGRPDGHPGAAASRASHASGASGGRADGPSAAGIARVMVRRAEAADGASRSLGEAGAHAVPQAAGAASGPKPGEYEVCGHGIVRGEPPWGAASAPGVPDAHAVLAALESHWQPKLDAWTGRLATSTDPSGASVAALLQGRPDVLVPVALRLRDARIVQWALQACGLLREGQPGDPVCHQLSTRAWVNVEPDNGAAWLDLLQREPAALAEALHGLTRAAYFDEGFGAAAAAIEAAAPREMPLPMRVALQLRSLGVDAARPMPYLSLMQACSAAATADANRRQVCQVVAELLAERSRGMMARQIGVALGERSGWPAERVAALRQRNAEAQARLLARWRIGPGLSCGQAETLAQLMTDLGRRGEWAAAGVPAAPR